MTLHIYTKVHHHHVAAEDFRDRTSIWWTLTYNNMQDNAVLPSTLLETITETQIQSAISVWPA